MERNRIVGWILFILSGVGAGAQQEVTLPLEVAESGFADMVVVNAKIVTMDDNTTRPAPGTIVQAMAIKGPKVIALGSDERVRRFAGPKTQVIDARGRVIIPGLVESHGHIYSDAFRWVQKAGVRPLPIVVRPVAAAPTLEETQKRVHEAVREMVASAKPGEWLQVEVSGRLTNLWRTQRRLVRIEDLDRIAPNHPVHVTGETIGPPSLLNSKALALAEQTVPGFERQLKLQMEHTGYGQKLGDSPLDQQRGWLGLPEKWVVTWEILLRDEPIEKIARMLEMESEAWAAYGVTSIATRIPLPKVISGYAYLNRNNRMPIRMAFGLEVHRALSSVTGHPRFYEFLGNLTDVGNDYFWVAGVSSEMWDVNYPRECLGPDLPNISPELKALQLCQTPENYYYQTLFNALKSGWRIFQIHNLSSHGARLFNQMVERAMNEGRLSEEEIRNLRITVEHCTAIGDRPDVVAGWKRFGTILSCAPVYFLGTPQGVRTYGEGYLSLVTPIKSLIEKGVRVLGQAAGGPTEHVGMFYWMYVFITRQVDPDATPEVQILPLDGIKTVTYKPEERVDRVIALKMWTNWAAEYLGQGKEALVGSLEVGKLADFVVLDRDYFTVAEKEIPRVKPLLTTVGGKIVYLHRDLAAELGREAVGYQPPRDWPRFPSAEEYQRARTRW